MNCNLSNMWLGLKGVTRDVADFVFHIGGIILALAAVTVLGDAGISWVLTELFHVKAPPMVATLLATRAGYWAGLLMAIVDFAVIAVLCAIGLCSYGKELAEEAQERQDDICRT